MEIIREGKTFVAYGKISKENFDRVEYEFWKNSSAQTRLDALRQLIEFAVSMGKLPNYEPRLDRTAVRLVRKRG